MMISTWIAAGLLSLTVPTPACAAPGIAPSGVEDLEPLCAEGAVLDDSTVETGYGWVPSVIDGRYVQTFSVADLSGRRLDEVCVCWLRTRADETIDFEVQVYYGHEGRPVMRPFGRFPARAEAVPEGVTGRMYSIPTGGLSLPDGEVFIGVAWDASVDQFFFVCADHSDSTPPVEVFFIDDRADEWVSVFETQDPIFANHSAIMVRAVASVVPAEIPTLGPFGLASMSMLVLLAGFWLSSLGRRRRSG